MGCGEIIVAWILITVLATRIDCKSYVEEDPDNPGYKRRCIEDLEECFSNAYPWHDYPRRPASLVPEECENITFNLFTKYNRDEPYIVKGTPTSILLSPFNASWPTQLYIHAYWADQGSMDRELEKKDAAFHHRDFNVIIPDFRDHVQIPYFKAISNVRVIAARIAKFLKILMKVTGIKPQSIHLIGFSLGCHTSAYIGKRIPFLGRITALSPAGRNFLDTHDDTRLRPSDAMLVDVIHSSGSGEYGIQELDSDTHNGHQNFLVNGAKRQPGCKFFESDSPVVNFLKDFPETYCDHTRSNLLWMESMTNTDCVFRAVKCPSYEDFQQGRCTPDNSPVAILGVQGKQVKGIGPEDHLYLDTGAEPPFCSQYNVLPGHLWRVEEEEEGEEEE